MTYYHNNYHSNEWIIDKVEAHVGDATTHYPKDRIIGCFYQGSGNYGLDYEGSDVDTKCIIIPDIEDLVTMNRQSWCNVRHNDEHTDFKDVRLMFELFMKQNVNFLEILFTPFCYINPMYKDLWDEVMSLREDIVTYARASLLKSLKGIAGEKYHALEHRYPSRIEWLDKFGYDPKQLHHLIRIEEFIRRWLLGESFEKCLISKIPNELIDMKKGWADLETARKYAKDSMTVIEALYKANYDKLVEEGSWTTCNFAETSSKLYNIATKMIERYLKHKYSEEEYEN